MSGTDRRTFLKLMGTGAMALSVPPSIRKAVAIPAHDRTRTIRDVEHVIFLMQENRSFDHYFGTLRGVRGFADPHPITLPTGKPVWRRPAGRAAARRPRTAGADGHAAFNGGR